MKRLLLRTASAPAASASATRRRHARSAVVATTSPSSSPPPRRSYRAAAVTTAASSSSSSSAATTTKAGNETENDDVVERAAAVAANADALRKEASFLSRSLYRSCVRSARLVGRPGNQHDDREFAERERLERQRLEERFSASFESAPSSASIVEEEEDQHRANGSLTKRRTAGDSTDGDGVDIRLSSMLSMLPPVDREDELRSRSEYYLQYARENFVQESDCLDFQQQQQRHSLSSSSSSSSSARTRRGWWSEQQIERFVHHVRKGNDHRKWLLADMKFDDPFAGGFDSDRVDAFERDALAFVRRQQQQLQEQTPLDPATKIDGMNSGGSSSAATKKSTASSIDDDDDFFDEDGDKPLGLPSWYKNPRSQ